MSSSVVPGMSRSLKSFPVISAYRAMAVAQRDAKSFLTMAAIALLKARMIPRRSRKRREIVSRATQASLGLLICSILAQRGSSGQRLFKKIIQNIAAEEKSACKEH